MKQVEMWKWFKLPVDCELLVNADKSSSSRPDSIAFVGHNVLTGHHVEKVEIAINSYDANQAIIAKQGEQIKMLRDALGRILSSIDEYSYVNEYGFNVVEVFDITHKCGLGNEALEATKEQA